jgi:hypothetical protein
VPDGARPVACSSPSMPLNDPNTGFPIPNPATLAPPTVLPLPRRIGFGGSVIAPFDPERIARPFLPSADLLRGTLGESDDSERMALALVVVMGARDCPLVWVWACC